MNRIPLEVRADLGKALRRPIVHARRFVQSGEVFRIGVDLFGKKRRDQPSVAGSSRHEDLFGYDHGATDSDRAEDQRLSLTCLAGVSSEFEETVVNGHP